MLKVGDKAPFFSLPDAAMDYVSLENYTHHKNVVLYFFPKISMPTCAQMAEEYSDHESDFDKLHTTILGICSEDCFALEDFQEKHGLSMSLLSDSECEVSASYGVLKPKQGDPSGKQVITRSTFVIDKAGVIRHVFVEGLPKGHATQVLNLIKDLKEPTSTQTNGTKNINHHSAGQPLND